MALFVVRHQHAAERCPAQDPYLGAMLLNHLSRPNVRRHGVKIQGEAIAVADILSAQRTERTFRIENRSHSIVTLPVSHVEVVKSVAVDGTELARGEFTWVPGTNWIALAHPDDNPHVVEIRTVWSPFQSLAVASHDPTIGFHLVISHYQAR